MKLELKTPDLFVRSFFQSLTHAEKSCFAGALLTGLFTHLYVFTNKLYNYDELVHTPQGYGLGAELNRWFLEIMGRTTSDRMGGTFSLPLWNGMLTLLLLTVSAMLVVRMFALDNAVFSFFIGAFMTSVPPVVCMFYFMYTAAFYAVGICLSVLAAYLLVRYPQKIWVDLAAVILLCCSVATYQSYFSNTVCLLLIGLILQCVDERSTFRELLLLAVRYLALLVLSLALYLGMNRLLLRYWQIPPETMGGYQGLDTMGQVGLSDILAGIQKSYQSFFMLAGQQPVLSMNVRALQMRAYQGIFLLLLASIAGVLLLQKNAWTKKLLLAALVAAFPVGVFLIYLMAPEAYGYPLMFYSLAFLFVLFFALLHRAGGVIFKKLPPVKSLMEWAATAVSVVLLFFYVWYGNGNYMSMDYTKMRDFAYLETMVTQIKSLDGYSDELPLAFIGNDIVDETEQTSVGIEEWIFHMAGRSLTTNINGIPRLHLITDYLNYTPVICDYVEACRLMQLQEVRDMPCYPDQGSIQIVDDVIVVKISDEG